MALNQVPQAGQTLAVTQNPILNNFATIDTSFSVDHVAYQAVGSGKHNKITFPVQAAAPVPTSSDTNIYSAASTLLVGTGGVGTATNQLFFSRNAGNAITPNPIPFTASRQYGTGWTYLPSGILLMWDSATVEINGNTSTVNFPAAAGTIPTFTAVFNVQITPYGNSAPVEDPNIFVTLWSFNSTSLTVYPSQRTSTAIPSPHINAHFYYLVIGY